MTLVEVMVSLVLSTIVVGAAFGLLAGQRPILQSQLQLQKRQQDLFVAMELVQRDIRRAGMGFGFCQKTVGAVTYRAQVDCFPSSASNVQVMRAIDIVDGGTSGPDRVTVTYGQPSGSGSADALLAEALGLYGATVAKVNDARAFMRPYPGCDCGACAPATTPQYAVFFDPLNPATECAVVQVTSASCSASPPTLTIDPRPNIGSCQNAPYVPSATQSYGANTAVVNLGALTWVTYSIDATDPQNPMLMRSVNGAAAQPIAFGIEDLQLVPACDVNGDGAIALEPPPGAARTSDEWLNNVAGDTVPATCTTYPQVRVTLVARTTNPDTGAALGGRPALENRSAGTPDRFRRRVLGAVVGIPNMGL